MPRELSRDAPVRDCPGNDDEASPGCPEGRERSFLPCLPPAPPVFPRPASREERPGSLPRLPSGTVALACTGTFLVPCWLQAINGRDCKPRANNARFRDLEAGLLLSLYDRRAVRC